MERLYTLRPQFFTNSGVPLASGRMFFYLAGTTTKATTYSDSGGTTQNTNPITLDAYGRPSVEIWVSTNQSLTVGLYAAGSDDPPATPIWQETYVFTRQVASDWLSVFEFFTRAQVADVQNFTGSVDVTTPLNTAFAYGANNSVGLRMPAGKYKITDTLWATPQGSSFRCASIRGEGGGFSSSNRKTYIDATAITSKPAINFQKIRGSYIGHLQIVGGNMSYSTTYTGKQMLYGQTYVSGGIRDDRYSPYCGIAIDAGVGPTPSGGGYSGFTYQNSSGGSSGLCIDNVTIRNFVVGLMHNPETSGASQGDGVVLINPTIQDCKTSIACGQSQARACNVFGGNIGWFRTALDCQNYGKQQGAPFRFFGTQMGSAFQLFEIPSTFGLSLLNSIYAEDIHRIGQVGQGSASGAEPVQITGCELNFIDPATQNSCPLILEANNLPVLITGGYMRFPSTTFGDVMNFIGIPTTFDSVLFVQMKNRFKPFIGADINWNNPAVMRNCHIHDGNNITLGDQSRKLSPPARLTRHWSDGLVKYGTATYDVVHGNGNNYINVSSASAFSWTTTQLTFTLSTTTNLLVGDILMWQMGKVASSLVAYYVPALKVNSITGTTIVCDLLFDSSYYDQTQTPSNIPLVTHEWAPGQAHTGDTTNGSPTIANVSPTSILQNGDFIKGTGIPSNTRVVSGAGTATITMSQNATATNTGISLYYAQFKTFTEAAAW